jgi:hypothetical protein
MKWISVKERFPPSNTLVLNFEKGWGYDICSYNAEERIWRIFGDNDPTPESDLKKRVESVPMEVG